LAAGDSSSPPPYILGSCSQASLLLHSPLRSPRRPRRINLVPETSVAASPPMAGPGDDPEPDSTKLDRILTKLSTISRRLDFHDQRIAHIEKFQHGDPTKPEDDLSRAAVGPEGAAHSVGGGRGAAVVAAHASRSSPSLGTMANPARSPGSTNVMASSEATAPWRRIRCEWLLCTWTGRRVTP
jgi:hypothetical protein